MRPERELIDMIRELVTRDPEDLLELGRDDASARELSRGIYVFNTDMVASSTDLLPGMSLELLARKCVVSNFSDLAAKGAKPLFFIASAGLPRDMSSDDFISIVKGLERGSREHGAYFTGGDLGEARELIIAGFAAGRVASRLVRRDGARPGHIIMTTGGFGLTWLGFQHLLKGMDLPDEIRELALRAVYEPVAKVKEGLALSNYATSAVDSSDGLYWSLKELSRASGYGFVVEDLPIDPRIKEFVSEAGLDPLEVVFHGGEEYELVFTVAEEDVTPLREEFSSKGLELFKIGRVVETPGVFAIVEGKSVEVREGGWEHFKSRYK